MNHHFYDEDCTPDADRFLTPSRTAEDNAFRSNVWIAILAVGALMAIAFGWWLA